MLSWLPGEPNTAHPTSSPLVIDEGSSPGGKLKPAWALLSSGHLLMSKLDGYNGQILIFILLTPSPHYQRWLFLTSLVRHAVLSIKLYKFVRDDS